MKKTIAMLLLGASLLSLTGCGPSQEEYDALASQLETVQSDLADCKDDLKDSQKQLKSTKESLNQQIAGLENDKKDLEGQLATLKSSLIETQEALKKSEAALDELKNGPEAQLAAIRTAYDKADWKQVVSLANALHKKYPGYDEDLEGQDLAQKAQKTMDDEAAKAAAEAAKSKEDKVHGLIRITRLDCSKPNSADGVGIYLEFLNMHPEKTIKYLEVTVRAKNAVGDTQYCDIRHYSSYTCEATGPYAPGKGLTSKDNWWWPNAWYNSTIKTVELVGVSIDYMDGTWVTLKSDELPYAIW